MDKDDEQPNKGRELDRGAATVLAFVAACYAALTIATHAPSPFTVSIRFYEVAAQVIPVLLLAAAIEGRAFRGRPQKRLGAALGLILLGEMSALMAVAFQARTDELAAFLTLIALVMSAALVVVAALYGPKPRPAADER